MLCTGECQHRRVPTHTNALSMCQSKEMCKKSDHKCIIMRLMSNSQSRAEENKLPLFCLS